MVSSRNKGPFSRWLKGDLAPTPQVTGETDDQQANHYYIPRPISDSVRYTRPVRVREIPSGSIMRQWMTGSLPVDVEPVVVERYHTASSNTRTRTTTTPQQLVGATNHARYVRPVRGAPSGGFLQQWMNGTLRVDTPNNEPVVQRPKQMMSADSMSAQLIGLTTTLTKANFVTNNTLAGSSMNNSSSEIFCKETNMSSGSTREEKLLIKIPLSQSSDSSKNSRMAPCVCAICLDAYQINDIISLSPNTECPHVFHKSCILKYGMSDHAQQAEGHIHCPLCRRNFFRGPPTSHKKE